MKKILIILICLSLCGCSSWLIRPVKTVILPEERIFRLEAGTPVKVVLDKKPMDMTFPNDMFLVSPTVLVRQEEALNNAVLHNVKANADKKTLWGVIASILAIVAGVFGIFKKKWWPKVSMEVK